MTVIRICIGFGRVLHGLRCGAVRGGRLLFLSCLFLSSFLSFALSAQTLIDSCNSSGESEFTSGSGSMNDPFQVTNLCQLQAINSTLSGHYVLAEDIDASPTSSYIWTPIGISNNNGDLVVAPDEGFYGSLSNSSGHVISGMRIDLPSSSSVGLFSVLGGDGSLDGIILSDAQTTGNSEVGAMVGLSGGNVSGSSMSGRVSANGSDAGGLVGHADYVTISDSYATGAVSANGSDAGGLVGRADHVTISNSYATGAVNANSSDAGGLVGIANNVTIANSYATGEVTGTRSLGGLVGSSSHLSINNSYATGAVSADDFYAGGLVGFGSNDVIVNNSYATGAISVGLSSAQGTAGGFVGSGSQSSFDLTVSNSYYTGPDNNLEGERRTLTQLQCPTVPSATCEGATTFIDWSSDIWYFGTSMTLPLIFDPTSLTVTVVPAALGTVVSDTGGINCGSSCTGIYHRGTTVTLTARAGSGYVLDKWEDDCAADSSTPDQAIVTLDEDKSCRALFAGVAEDIRLRINVLLGGALIGP